MDIDAIQKGLNFLKTELVNFFSSAVLLFTAFGFIVGFYSIEIFKSADVYRISLKEIVLINEEIESLNKLIKEKDASIESMVSENLNKTREIGNKNYEISNLSRIINEKNFIIEKYQIKFDQLEIQMRRYHDNNTTYRKTLFDIFDFLEEISSNDERMKVTVFYPYLKIHENVTNKPRFYIDTRTSDTITQPVE